jgi:hypothetical protein
MNKIRGQNKKNPSTSHVKKEREREREREKGRKQEK